jgi:hypothetical protein
MRRVICVVSAVLFCLAASRTASAQSQGFKSGTQKYSEKNPAGGKGRSGGATMGARMLYGKDGNTLLEATTGDFESNAAPTGEFTRMKVTAIDANGVEMFSYNYSQVPGGTYFTQTYAGLFPGQPFTVHGHIRSDVKKNSNIIVTTSVQKRPDLYAERIVTPSRVPAGIPVQITGVVTELNGHIGARSDCVLYADNVEIDRTIGIWVDSGDSVSCAFSPTFTALGAVMLKLEAESVAPGDWDGANNSLERLIEVSDLTPEFDVAVAEAIAVDVDNTTFAQQGRFVNSTLTAGYDWSYEETVDRNSDAFVYAGAAVGITHVPYALQATATDGVASWLLQRAVPGCFDFAVGRVNGRSFYTYVTGCGNLYVEVGSYAGIVTYASRLLTRTFHVTAGSLVYDGPAQFIYNNVSTEVGDGENLLHGNVWTIDVQVAAGPFVFSAPVSVSLNQAFEDGESSPVSCTTTPTSVACSQSAWRIAGRSGVAVWERAIPTP